MRFAYLYALHANLNRGKDDNPVNPATFLDDFDFWKQPPTEEELRAQTLERIKAAMRQMMADQKYVAEENARVIAAQSGKPLPKGVVLGPDGQPVR